MSQITAPPTPTLAAEQGATISALSMLLAEFSDLPAAYITMHPRAGCGFGLQLDTAHDAEAWREALGIDPQAVSLKANGGIAWTQVDTHYRGVRVHLTGHGVPLTVEQASARQAAPIALAAVAQVAA